MNDNEPAEPGIKVNPSPAPDMLTAGARQIAAPIVAFMLGRHFIADDTGQLILALVGIAAPILYGQWRTRHRAKQLAEIARSPLVPDSVATLKAPSGDKS